MATKHIGIEGVGTRRAALSDREFAITKKGYDRQEVRAFLADVEASVVELEEWALRANARLAIAEEAAMSKDELDEAMIAVFKTKDRVLAEAHHKAARIEAEAIERGRAEEEAVGAKIIAEAQKEAERIIYAALSTTTPPGDHDLAQSQKEADRLIEDAQAEADRIVSEGRAQAERMTREALAENETELVEPAAIEDDPSLTVIVDDDTAERPSRYQRTSAQLPSTDVEAADVYGTIERLRRSS